MAQCPSPPKYAPALERFEIGAPKVFTQLQLMIKSTSVVTQHISGLNLFKLDVVRFKCKHTKTFLHFGSDPDIM